MTTFSKQLSAVLVLSVLVAAACSPRGGEPRAEGHYTYEHAFDYTLHGNRLGVQETGTMDFLSDGSALDSACQEYTATLAEGGTATYVFNYVSPSRWHLNGAEFHFAGIKESFRMELLSTDTVGCTMEQAALLAQDIISVVGGSIDYEYTFHLDTLTTALMQWSFVYPDGHSDTWLFHRQ